MNEVTNECNKNLNKLHVIDLHLTFRWKAYLTKGFNPHILEPFRSYARLFINVVEDLTKVQNKLLESSWGDRHIIEPLYWRDEEKYLTDIFADICGLERAYVMGCSEPPAEMEKLIWHPDIKKVYLSFPITNIIKDKEAKKEITDFKDEIREFLMLFDPHSVKDYDDTYVFEEMREIRKEVGHTTEERDYRLIDQADAVVVYFPKHVGSKGVDAEMNYARQTGKPIYKYTPGKKEEGPFAVPPSHFSDNPKEFVKLLKEKLS
jgi:nucleoside 2-deoxyribosyltransferase